MKPLFNSLASFANSHHYWRPEKYQAHLVFLFLAAVFGFSFLIVTPPFQIPDEPNHFLKAYQVSTGQLMGVREMDRVGGYIPIEVIEFSDFFNILSGDIHVKTNASTIWELRKTKHVTDSLVFVDFPSTGKYSFINYLPQSLSILVINLFTDKVFWIYYGAKLFTLAFWLACVTMAIYIIPVHKWLFTALALLPMSLYINSSLSGDVVTNAAAYLFIAYLLKLVHSDASISIQNFLLMMLFMVVLASTKLVYTPLLLLVFLIPKKNFSSYAWQQIQFIGALFIGTLLIALYWYFAMKSIYTPYADYHPDFREGLNVREGVNMSKQIIFLRDNPGHILTVLFNATGHTFDMVYEGFIGTFGWLETRLPLWLISLGYLVLFSVAVLEPAESGNSIQWKYRIIPLTAFIVILGLIIMTLYLTWTYVGADYVHIQGRYLIPAAPLLLIVFSSRRWNFPNLTPLLVGAFSILSLSISYQVLVNRYYGTPVFDSTHIKCGAEETYESKFVTNTDNVLLENAHTQSSDHARTGDYCAKVTPEQQYSFTYRIEDIEYGDIVRAEVWRLGVDAGLVLTSGNANELYLMKSKSHTPPEDSWERITMKHVFNERVDNNEAVIYVFNFGEDIVYFDDLHITIEKMIK